MALGQDQFERVGRVGLAEPVLQVPLARARILRCADRHHLGTGPAGEDDVLGGRAERTLSRGRGCRGGSGKRRRLRGDDEDDGVAALAVGIALTGGRLYAARLVGESDALALEGLLLGAELEVRGLIERRAPVVLEGQQAGDVAVHEPDRCAERPLRGAADRDGVLGLYEGRTEEEKARCDEAEAHGNSGLYNLRR